MTEDKEEFIRFYLEDGILFSEFTKLTVIDLAHAKRIISLREEISNGENQYWCYDIKGMKSMDIDARNYADKNGQQFLSACAVIVHTPVTKFIFNVFVRLKSPKIPFRCFTERDDAISWLKKMKAKCEKKQRRN